MNNLDILKEAIDELSSLFEVVDVNNVPGGEQEVNKVKKVRKDKDGNRVATVSVEDELFPPAGNTAKEQFNSKVIETINKMIEGTATLEDLMQLVANKKNVAKKQVKESLEEKSLTLVEEIINELLPDNEKKETRQAKKKIQGSATKDTHIGSRTRSVTPNKIDKYWAELERLHNSRIERLRGSNESLEEQSLTLVEEIINELLPANQENVMRTQARRRAAISDKDVTRARAEKAYKDWDKNYDKHGLKASKNLQFKKDVANRASDDHGARVDAENRNYKLTSKWQERHPDKNWEDPELDLNTAIANAKKSLQYDKDARKEEDKKFPTYDMKTDKATASKKEDNLHPKNKPETRDIEKAYGIDNVDIKDQVDSLEKLHKRRNGY